MLTPVTTEPEAALNECQLEMTVSIKRGKNGKWRAADEFDEIVSGHSIEIVVTCSCRAAIDIKPDRGRTVNTIDWAEMTFFPEGSTRTRVKTAYYRPRKIRRRTEVEFTAKARCRCADCAGVAEASFILVFDDTAV